MIRIYHNPLSQMVLEFLPFEVFLSVSSLYGLMTKQPFSKVGERANELLGLIHTDVCGPMSTNARGGFSYFITFTHDFGRYGYVYLMKHKSESFDKFKDF